MTWKSTTSTHNDTSLSSLSLNSLCSQRSGFPDWRSQRKNNPGFGRSASLMLQLLLTSTEAPWPKSTLSHCSLVWKAGTQKTGSIEGYFLGGASVTLGSLYAPETQICQLEARNGPCLGIETMFCGQSLEWTIPFSPCFLLRTGPGRLIKVQPLTAAIGVTQDTQGYLEQELCLACQQQSTSLKWTFFPCNIPPQVPFLCLLIVTEWFSTPRMKFFCLYNHLFLLNSLQALGAKVSQKGPSYLYFFYVCLQSLIQWFLDFFVRRKDGVSS